MAKLGNQRFWIEAMPDNPEEHKLSNREGLFRIVMQKKVGTRWVTHQVIENDLTLDDAKKKMPRPS
ncbi:MAG: hypothetical protein JWM21_294 [Acidobacteria bacterium]|nr:hypothetical protein [Acidobacteriota bacterium]